MTICHRSKIQEKKYMTERVEKRKKISKNTYTYTVTKVSDRSHSPTEN